MFYTHCESKIGTLLLAADEQGLRHIGFPGGKGRLDPAADWQQSNVLFKEAERQLNAYFEGELERFELVLAPTGTAFQLRVLDQLLRIPYGETRSYADVALGVGSPRAVRAVGAANGRNPLPIVIPCHRVIGANGSLVGFGGGLPVKRFLLELESGVRNPVFQIG